MKDLNKLTTENYQFRRWQKHGDLNMGLYHFARRKKLNRQTRSFQGKLFIFPKGQPSEYKTP